MDKIIFNDESEFSIADGASLENITAILNKFSDLNTLYIKLTQSHNLDSIHFGADDSDETNQYKNLKLILPLFHSVDVVGTKVYANFGLREKTSDEIILDEINTKNDAINLAITYLSDEEALTVKELIKSWDDDPDGYEYNMDNPLDLRRTYNERLWRLKKAHAKQASWYPGAEGTLWEEVIEGHAGTLEDPIPVPDSVNVSGFTYEYGKYYKDGDQIYIAKRDGKNDGEIETLFYKPSQLVGQYFELVIE